MASDGGSLTNSPMLEQVFVNPDHSSQVLYQLSELWRDKKLCDATIEVGPVKVYVHRLVLLAACPYLLTVGGQHEVSILEVKLPMTVGLEGLNVFLTYLYDGVLHLTSANLRSVEKLTKILKVTSIQKFCQEFRDSNKETGTADKLATDYSLKMTNSSLQIIFSEIQNELKRENIEQETETPSKRPRMNLDKLSAALQKKTSQSDSVKDNGRGHSVSNVSLSGPSESQSDKKEVTSDPLVMHVKEEPMSDYEDEDDASYSEDTSESLGYSGTTDFVRQAPYDTRPFPDETSVTSGNKMIVAIPPPPSLQKRPSLRQKSFPPSAQHVSQTSETVSGLPSENVNSGELGASDEGNVDATKVLKNIVKSMPEMAMNLGTSSEIGEDNKPRSPRTTLTLNQRIEVIRLSENGYSSRMLAKHFQVGRTQILRILKYKEKLLEVYEITPNKDQWKRIGRRTEYEDINNRLWSWVQQLMASSASIRISGPLLREKALEIAKETKNTEFKASNGWLSSFLKRNSLHLDSRFKCQNIEPSTSKPSTHHKHSTVDPADLKDTFQTDGSSKDFSGNISAYDCSPGSFEEFSQSFSKNDVAINDSVTHNTPTEDFPVERNDFIYDNSVNDCSL
ncbi:uncharacterized protein LOC132559270 isoform X3 [Ylistrum balloti]|uniref:uncharacterized protein LOC132559270 isoform X3 n=1 Tax=Ylistrum balloti TaxID=509963 RepID=UPI002905AEF4|nr:uncharacterized protein LOC132559270 isoform X3 [Ylistrum balloti]